jgi:hypothetical protein
MWQRMTAYFIEAWNYFLAPFGIDGTRLVERTVLQAERSRVRLSMVSVKFFIDIILPAAIGPWSRLSF